MTKPLEEIFGEKLPETRRAREQRIRDRVERYIEEAQDDPEAASTARPFLRMLERLDYLDGAVLSLNSRVEQLEAVIEGQIKYGLHKAAERPRVSWWQRRWGK